MSIIQAVILGLIQGLTEFLPISSSGHLVLFQKIFGINEPALLFDTMLHVGTLAAVVTVLRKDILSLLKKPFQKLTWLLLAGTIPTVIIAIMFKDFFEEMFRSGSTLGIEFFITGFVLLFAEKLNAGVKHINETSYLDAAFIGVMQGVAIMPAVSRSGLTISGALLRNLDREFAAKFSFLLSIPSILGGAVFQIKDIIEAGSGRIGNAPIIAGTAAAAIAGYFSVRFMIVLIKKGSMKYFSYYVFGLGAFVLIDQYLTHVFF
ncbi:MAG TPA: undecaprenyl-diphosphate phosphatase [Bacillota bacterium]|nr:undecaprenyl-diphosphate phosphatase [Bacillota bacterium]HPL54201.1 undecaprenyl-diphosphate phosphatase [Bacillota bacterium]